MPEQPESASERPNAGAEAAATTILANDPVLLAEGYAADVEDAEDRAAEAEQRAASWWEAAKHFCELDRDGDRARGELAFHVGEQRRRAEAAEAKLRDAEHVRHEVEKILDGALGPNEEDGAGLGLAGDVALLAERKKALEDRLDQVRVVLLQGGQDAASVRREAISVVLGESDRVGHRGDHKRRALLAEERLAQVTEWCKEARAQLAEVGELLGFETEARIYARKRGTRYRAERDEAQGKLVEISDLIGDDDPCHDTVNHTDAHNLLNEVRKALADHLAEPVPDREAECGCCTSGSFTPNPYVSEVCGDGRLPESSPRHGCGHAKAAHAGPVTDREEPAPVAYAEHERVVLEEIKHRGEAEDWADRLASALAPASVRGEHSNGNNPWRNALEYAQASEEPVHVKPKHGLGCSRIGDECVSYHCHVCGEPTNSQGSCCRDKREEPNWDSVADSYRISEDHEEPASEEPAGETKPTVGDGGDYIRKNYRVPAEVGRKIRYRGAPGEIVGFDPGTAYLQANVEGFEGLMALHPTWEIEYLTDDSETKPEAQR